MSRRVIIDERVLDKLLIKSLPAEYEVLTQNHELSEDEASYLIELLSLLEEIIGSTQEWVLSFNISDLEELDVFFFDEMRDRINGIFREHFLSVGVLLDYFWEDGKSVAIRELNVPTVDFTNESLAFASIKHQNHQVISNLIDGVCNNLKDSIWNDIKDKLDIDKVAENLLKNGLKPIGKFTPQQRAKMIAVTERSRAYNSAKLQTYHNYGVKLVDIITAGDSKVCTICLNNAMNNPYTITEAQGMIPTHPYCRCTFRPHFDEEQYIDEIIPEDFVVDLTNY